LETYIVIAITHGRLTLLLLVTFQVQFQESQFENMPADDRKRPRTDTIPTLFSIQNPPKRMLHQQNRAWKSDCVDDSNMQNDGGDHSYCLPDVALTQRPLKNGCCVMEDDDSVDQSG